MNELSVSDVLKKSNNYNLAIPFTETRQINPFYAVSVSLVTADTSDEAGHVYKVGSKKEGNQWIYLYSLTKPFLQKLATEAGIQFAPGAGDVIKVDENTWKSSAFGGLRLPDNSVRTSSNFKVIDLKSEEEKYRLSYKEKAVSGIVDYKAANDAAAKYRGKWVETGQVNDKGYKIKKFVVDEADREKYIEASLLDAMTVLRAHAPQKAATGAILRVIRDLLGIKSTYTLAELKKPFAVARISFSPDYSDPMVKQMMLQSAMQSVGNLFGNPQPMVQTMTIPQAEKNDIEVLADPEPIPAVQPDVLNQTEMSQEIPVENTVRAEHELNENGYIEGDLYCDQCGATINEKVYEWSINKFGRPLCMKCQRGGRR